MKEGEILQHGKKEEVLNGDIFNNLDINKPFFYSIFNKMQKNGVFDEPIPVSLDDALNVIKNKL
jgi:hypothetical protein